MKKDYDTGKRRRECFNRKWGEGIDWICTKESGFGSLKNQKVVNIEQTIFYLKSQYLEHNPQERTFIPNIPSEEPSFEAITENLKTFLKSIKEDENMVLKRRASPLLVGGY